MLSLFATLLSFAKLALLLLTRKSMNHYAQFHLLHSSPVRVGRDCCLPMRAATYTFVQVQKRIPLLFLYSKVLCFLSKLLLSRRSHSSLTRPSQDDHITDHKYLEHFVASLKQSGADAQSHVFGPKSGHVAHMYHHREAYLRQLDAFLSRVLAP
jgi:hypothetical protein